MLVRHGKRETPAKLEREGAVRDRRRCKPRRSLMHAGAGEGRLRSPLAQDGVDETENRGSFVGVEFHDLPNENGG